MTAATPPPASSVHPSAAAARPAWLTALAELVGPTGVSLRPDDLETYSRDLLPRGLLSVAGGQPGERRPGVVVWPRSVAELQAVVRLCHEHRVPLVPYGAGSGVAGGAVGPTGCLVVDTKRLRRVDIDEGRGVVTFEPGILGWHLEEMLNRRGLTLGHFPSSIMCSTAGGWVATRGAGQMSTKYGKIEDLVRSVELVTACGERLRLDNGDLGGLDWAQLATGSEGTLGIITGATCAVRPMPASRRLRGFSFPTVEAACRAIQSLLQHGVRPAVVRLYDEIDTLISGIGRRGRGHAPTPAAPEDPIGRLLTGVTAGQGKGIDFEELLRFLRPDAQRLKGRVERWLLKTVLGETEPVTRILGRLLDRLSADSVLILGFEGDSLCTAAEESFAREEMARGGGRDLGEEPGEHWLRHRYDVSFKMSRAFIAGAFTDTIEVASSWDRILPLYREVRQAVAPYALCMAHFSHAYPDGCSIYFTVVGRRDAEPGLPPEEARRAVAADERRYDALWRAAMEATLRVGATISHHHGVGRLKAPFMPGEHGESLRILSALRTACDPRGIANPGSLAPMTVAPGEVAALLYPGAELPLGEPDRQNLLIEVAEGTRLFELERSLRAAGLTLGGLPPAAYLRTIGDALRRPRPSEASLESGRLRDRRTRLRVLFPGAGGGTTEVLIPPHPVPRRATGPDLGAAIVGQERLPVTITAVTLRLHTYATEGRWAGYLFASPEAAAAALFAARRLHGAAGLSEVLVCNRPLIDRVLGRVLGDGAPGEAAGAWALFARPAGPPAVAAAALRALDDQLGGEASARLPAGIGHDLLCPEALFGAGATIESATAFAGRFPAHERALPLAESSPAGVAAALASTRGACLLNGVHLHGLALCLDEPAASPPADPAGAETVLFPRLAAALTA